MAGITYKNFVQSVASNTWEIEHGPNLRSVLDVVVDGAVVQPLSVTNTTNELLTITFAEPQTGIVRLLPWLPAIIETVVPLNALRNEDDVPLQTEAEEYIEMDV